MNYAVVTHLFSYITLATSRAVHQVDATLERHQRCGTAPRFLRLALFALVGATLVLSAPRAEALAIDVSFGNSSVNYTYVGNTAVLTAATIHNYSSFTSNNLRMELWAVAAPTPAAMSRATNWLSTNLLHSHPAPSTRT